MDLLTAFVIFVAVMILAIAKGFTMVSALLVGLVGFLWVGVHRGFRLGDLLKMGMTGTRDSIVVIEVMMIIGFLTASWRVSGTITIFVYYGMKLITPSLFLVVAFLLSCLLSYAIGTSFGVAGTVGVIFMTLARSGGVDPVLTAGVLMSGVYFGDRGSPVSSSANMVAGITGTKIFDNVRIMMRQAVIPFGVCLAIYAWLSFRNPISHVDRELVQAFESSFNLSLWAFLPALIMLILPLLKVDVTAAMGLSVGSSILIARLVQGVPMLDILRACLAGYRAEEEGLGSILNGGGLVSMLEIIVILLISCMYSGIFNQTHMLEGVQDRLSRAAGRMGRFAVMLVLSVVSTMLFCNQTITTLMCNDLMKKPYADAGASKEELAIDMENSVILLACFIPWSIGATVPLSFFGVGIGALRYAFFMYGLPLFYLFAKGHWYQESQAASGDSPLVD